MLTEITYTLLCDGSSDRALLPLINWTIRQEIALPIDSQWADLSYSNVSENTLSERIIAAYDYYPCDILFIHRDSENQTWRDRKEEIEKAWKNANVEENNLKVCIIPVRMTEAWLLINENAIRRASSNPNGKATIELPSVKKLHSIPNPKQELKQLIEIASEARGRRRDSLNLSQAIHRVADEINDYSILRQLEAFNFFEVEVKSALRELLQ